jgi:hypothetical protein
MGQLNPTAARRRRPNRMAGSVIGRYILTLYMPHVILHLTLRHRASRTRSSETTNRELAIRVGLLDGRSPPCRSRNAQSPATD